MGGTISVAIRLSDEIRKPDEPEIYKMYRWTNSLQLLWSDPRLAKNDRSHLDEYLKQWIEMRDDYEKNKKTDNFQFNMTPVYAPYDAVPLAPDGYGLVVCDYQTQTILSMQGYTEPTSLLFMSSWDTTEDILHALRNNLLILHSYHPKNPNIRMEGKVANGLADLLEEYKKDYRSTIDILNKFGKMHGDTYMGFLIDLSPWTILEFKESPDGSAKFLEKLKDLNFEFSDADLEQWSEWNKRYDE